ncbi:MAG: prepilin-type N-terminal cleavage/methylation domain-containing protein [Chitinispirillia bacterium]|nr:prepilin-type N-terminal cleavage/methylation domain-containing protein [Chitinispirillia bacterium]MCL2241697.1 prepilin-type N-terminal cleavage/methylation domain-containing protein [Chitinispirillia bacterium]
MKAHSNKIRKNGFTLVEVIVVAVIVLILAAVAIPMYNGFVRQARLDTVNNLAETAAAAANSYWRKTNSNPPNIAALNVHYNANKYELLCHSIAANGGLATCAAGNTFIVVREVPNTNTDIFAAVRFRN